jgi:hypothetical protein
LEYRRLIMIRLIPVRYDTITYPDGVHSEIKEESAPLSIPHLKRFAPKYSLHTDPSASRKVPKDSEFLQEFPTLYNSCVEGIPQLWFNKQWANKFADFIKKVVGRNSPPAIIEVHPPYKDYCDSMQRFLENYRVFEERIFSSYPETEILIENRFGTRYKRGLFLISSYRDVVDFVSQLEKTTPRLKLGLVLDFPQLLAQSGMLKPKNDNIKEMLTEMFNSLKFCKSRIRSIHLWGPKKIDASGHFEGVHKEDLNGLFQYHKGMKKVFLENVYELLRDVAPCYFVPEVGAEKKAETDAKVNAIVKDLLSSGFVF